LLGSGHFTTWLQTYLFWDLKSQPRPIFDPWPSPPPFPQPLKRLLREVPVLEQESTDPGHLSGMTLWKYCHDDERWWKGVVLSHNTETYEVSIGGRVWCHITLQTCEVRTKDVLSCQLSRASPPPLNRFE
jgi:hypothetical protein